MAARQPAWERPGSPTGKKGPRRPWSDKEVKQLRSLAPVLSA
jgi:hypothetical protein